MIPVVAQIIYVGTGDSMKPNIESGQKLAIYPFRYDKLAPGMVVLRRLDGKEICHRTVKFIIGRGWVTKGDNNPVPDRGYMDERDFLGIAFRVTGETVDRIGNKHGVR